VSGCQVVYVCPGAHAASDPCTVRPHGFWCLASFSNTELGQRIGSARLGAGGHDLQSHHCVTKTPHLKGTFSRHPC